MSVAVRARLKPAPKLKPAPVPRPAGKQRLRLWLRLLRATRAIEAELRKRLRVQFRITLPQFDVMAALARRSDGMSMTELSRTLIVSNGNVTGIIARLVTDKMVSRQPAPGDRRSLVVKLTPKGQAQFAGYASAHQEWLDRVLADIDSAEAETLIRHLDGLPDRIRQGGGRP
jgi:DNA-binding MarR family transcriptional regulator